MKLRSRAVSGAAWTLYRRTRLPPALPQGAGLGLDLVEADEGAGAALVDQGPQGLEVGLVGLGLASQHVQAALEDGCFRLRVTLPRPADA